MLPKGARSLQVTVNLAVGKEKGLVNCRMGSFAPFGGLSFVSITDEGGQCFQHVLHEFLMRITKHDLHSEFLLSFFMLTAVPTSGRQKPGGKGTLHFGRAARPIKPTFVLQLIGIGVDPTTNLVVKLTQDRTNPTQTSLAEMHPCMQ